MNPAKPFSRRIAVVGGGVAGLGAAWTLSQRHEVTLYDSCSELGGHAHTAVIDLDGTKVAVDTGFIVYNAPNYPNLVALFDALGVESVASDMSFGVSLAGGTFEYAGSDINGILAQRQNLLRPRFWRMLRDIRRFYAQAPAYFESASAALSIGELLSREAYSTAFIDDHLMPMAAAIWSASRDDIARYPARAFIQFFSNHGLLNLGNRPVWRSVLGGSREYVTRMVADAGFALRTASKVSGIVRGSGHVVVRESSGATAEFDEIVIATHADQALALLEDASAREYAILSRFRYSANTAYLHRDMRLMPLRRAAWSSWNYIEPPGASRSSPLCVTYWMNRLQRLDTEHDLFVTLNPSCEPEPSLQHGRYDYAHPIFSSHTALAQRNSIALQGRRNTWFCGSYLGHGFHEDALQSGLWVAERLGCTAPWANGGHFDRLPSTYATPQHETQMALSA